MTGRKILLADFLPTAEHCVRVRVPAYLRVDDREIVQRTQHEWMAGPALALYEVKRVREQSHGFVVTVLPTANDPQVVQRDCSLNGLDSAFLERRQRRL